MDERYTIDPQPIGSGGFSKVFKGLDVSLDRPVAIKSLDPLLSKADEKDKERFRREARILAKLSHPNIPAIYDVVFEEDEFRIFFQFIHGNTLSQLIHNADSPLTISEVRPWFEQVASALNHAHENKIVHRDVKPENLIVTSDRKHCYLVDFGLALSGTELVRLTAVGKGVGTAGYMSPEQEKGMEPEPSDDLYSLGVCLYESLSQHRIHAPGYQYLSTQDETIPPTIDELILSCLSPRESRLKSAKEFSAKLLSSLQSHAPLSIILAEGQLHDIIEAIRPMSPMDFMQMHVGQRRAILSKSKDVVASTEPRLTAARSQFLCTLSTLAIRVASDDYAAIFAPALDHGYDRKIENWEGDQRIRQALNEAATNLMQPNHHLAVKLLLDWLQATKALQGGRLAWYYHSLRMLITKLMVNTHCEESDAEELDRVLSAVNDIQRKMQREETGSNSSPRSGA